MKTFTTEINETVETIQANSASEAAVKAVRKYERGRQHFASEAGASGLSVTVDGVEHVPAAYAAEGQPSWDWN
jgi:uncharacterized protein with PIN domain